jgi:hypothetical protein
MTTIKFERVERDCPANKTLRHNNFKSGIIYDWRVLIDGEHRAEFHRHYGGIGYELYDADGRPICAPGRAYHNHIGESVRIKSGFKSMVDAMLAAGKIPTLAEMAAKRKAEAVEKATKIAKVKAAERGLAISQHALELYAELKSVVAGMIACPQKAVACLLIEKIDAIAEERMAAVDAEPGRFNIYDR